MESINVEKIHALKRYKQQQFVSTLLFYPLATLTFGLFCTSPFWFPTTKNFICVSIPRVLSFFLSAKSLFILGNLIVIFLVKNSKIRHSGTSFDNNNKQVKILSNPEKIGSGEVKKYAVFPLTSKEVVSERQHGSKLVDFSSNERVDRVEYHKKEEMVEEELVWNNGKIENLEEETNEMSQEVEENLECNGGSELMIPCFSSDDLEKRADDFIAMVNKQIRLEAEGSYECL